LGAHDYPPTVARPRKRHRPRPTADRRPAAQTEDGFLDDNSLLAASVLPRLQLGSLLGPANGGSNDAAASGRRDTIVDGPPHSCLGDTYSVQRKNRTLHWAASAIEAALSNGKQVSDYVTMRKPRGGEGLEPSIPKPENTSFWTRLAADSGHTVPPAWDWTLEHLDGTDACIRIDAMR